MGGADRFAHFFASASPAPVSGPQASIGRLDAAVGHDTDSEKPAPMWWGPAADVPPMLGPAGSAHMSVLDYAIWAGWNAGAGKRGPVLVKPETLAYIHSAKIGTGRFSASSPRHAGGRRIRVGLGPGEIDWTAMLVLTHNGSNGFNLAKYSLTRGATWQLSP